MIKIEQSWTLLVKYNRIILYEGSYMDNIINVSMIGQSWTHLVEYIYNLTVRYNMIKIWLICTVRSISQSDGWYTVITNNIDVEFLFHNQSRL